MYLPPHFNETDRARARALIAGRGFATLVSMGPEPLVTHLPLQLDREGTTLTGHLARANPHSEALVDGARVLAIFHGPHGYVSPTWYADENPRVPNVPTWNYAVVHVTGTVTRIDDPAPKFELVRELAAVYEGDVPGAWSPGETVAHPARLHAIVGFSIAIETMEAKFKLSQNRSEADQRRVIEALEKRGFEDDRAMAALMRANLPAG